MLANATHAISGVGRTNLPRPAMVLPVIERWPRVSVLMPLLNEAHGLDEVLGSLHRQDYPGDWQLVAVDGGSTDGTVEILHAWEERLPQLVAITSSPAPRNLSRSLNLAVEQAEGEVTVRADAHTLYGGDYLRRNVEALEETGADLVGGPMRPEGSDPFTRAVSSVMVNPWVVGPAPYRKARRRRDADTVYLGAMRRSLLAELRFRRFPSAVAEDADLAYRIRKRGGRVILDPAIRSRYRPRSSPALLWKQFYRYGKGKAEMLFANREFPSARPLAPLGLVALLAAAVLAVPVSGWWWAPMAAVAAWLAYLGAATRFGLRRWLAAAVIQLANGLGLCRGLARGPGPVRRSLKETA